MRALSNIQLMENAVKRFRKSENFAEDGILKKK